MYSSQMLGKEKQLCYDITTKYIRLWLYNHKSGCSTKLPKIELKDLSIVIDTLKLIEKDIKTEQVLTNKIKELR